MSKDVPENKDANLTTVNDMIDDAFGDEKENKVHFRLIAAVIYLLARELRLLERRFFVECELYTDSLSPPFNVTEIKVQTNDSGKEKTTRKAKEAKLAKQDTSKKDNHTSKSTEGKATDTQIIETSTDESTESSDNTSTEISTSSSASTCSDYKSIGISAIQKTTIDKKDNKGGTMSVKSTNQKSTKSSHMEKESSGLSSGSEALHVKKDKILIMENGISKTTPLQVGDKGLSEEQKLSLVTRDQFENLLKSVAQLTKQYSGAMSEIPEVSENLENFEGFYKKTSFTDPIAALQLASRLEAVEKSADHIMQVLVDISKSAPAPGVNKTSAEDDKLEADKKHEERGKKDVDKQIEKLKEDLGKPDVEQNKDIGKQKDQKLTKGGQKETEKFIEKSSTQTDKEKKERSELLRDQTENSEIVPEIQKSGKSLVSEIGKISEIVMPIDEKNEPDNDAVDKEAASNNKYVTRPEMKEGINSISKGIYKTMADILKKTVDSAESTSKSAIAADKIITQALNLPIPVAELEYRVSAYADRINIVDATLSIKMTEYQDALTTMTTDIEVATDAMIESIAGATGASTEANDLNVLFNKFEIELFGTAGLQNDFREKADINTRYLEMLQKEVAVLEDVKSTREEVELKIGCKAGLKELNEQVEKDYFFAVTGDWEKRICAAYDKFNSQEYTWQKLIDEAYRNLNKKADKDMLRSLFESIDSNVLMLKDRMNFMLGILGESRLPEEKKYMMSEVPCLSCGVPIQDHLFPLADGVDNELPKKSIIHLDLEVSDFSMPEQKCYPGMKLLRPPPTRSRICSRGFPCMAGPQNIKITLGSILPRPDVQKLEKNPKPKVKDEVVRKPCFPCNKKQSKPDLQKASKAGGSAVISTSDDSNYSSNGP